MFDDERNREILKLIKGGNGERVLVQVPEGLKTGVQRLLGFLERNGIEALLSVEPCFGACDLRDEEAKKLGCDLLLHIGHRDFGLKTKIPVIYYEYFMDYDFVPLVERVLDKLKPYKKLCLVTTVQFLESLGKVKEFLGKRKFKVYIGGSILGCDHSDARKYENIADAFLFIGSGRFHPLGLQERTRTPVLFLDIEKRYMENLSKEKDRLEIKREMRVQKAKEAVNFAVVISTKSGQVRLKTAERIKEKLKKMGKNVHILVSDQITPEKLLGLEIDVIVNTACPRIREDSSNFKKVVLNPEDVEKL